MSTWNINGVSYSGNSDLNIVGGRIIIDGVVQDGELLKGVVEIRVIEGSIKNLKSDATITCGNVTGDVDAGMTVHCKNVTGNVDAGMSVHCGKINGKAKAGMSIHSK